MQQPPAEDCDGYHTNPATPYCLACIMSKVFTLQTRLLQLRKACHTCGAGFRLRPCPSCMQEICMHGKAAKQHATATSQAIPEPTTDAAETGLASGIGREQALSGSCERAMAVRKINTL